MSDLTIGDAVMNNILPLRKQKKLTHRELALLSRVGHRTIVRYESGESEPGISAAYRIAKALGAPIGKVFPPPSKEQATTEAVA
jgi:transcriptional regulator with XRE-family HTH domain